MTEAGVLLQIPDRLARPKLRRGTAMLLSMYAETRKDICCLTCTITEVNLIVEGEENAVKIKLLNCNLKTDMEIFSKII